MAKRTKVQLKTKVDQIIKPNGNREITPEKHNSIETDIIDSFLNVADGGFVIDQAAGYSSSVAITDDRQFASKKYVDDNSGGGASSFAELSGDPYDNSALAEALNEKQDTISSTDEITEGATNLYFTEERVLGALLDEVIPEDSVIEEGDTIQDFANKAQGQIDQKVDKSDYSYQTITDAATITLNANNKLIQNYYLDTVRTTITVNYSNFIDGSVVCVKVKKQSASNLTLTFSSASIGIGNTTNNNVVISSLANNYFEIIVEARVVSGTPEYYLKINPM
jgi:hypothetical protein